jgi:hypothetical protein
MADRTIPLSTCGKANLMGGGQSALWDQASRLESSISWHSRLAGMIGLEVHLVELRGRSMVSNGAKGPLRCIELFDTGRIARRDLGRAFLAG